MFFVTFYICIRYLIEKASHHIQHACIHTYIQTYIPYRQTDRHFCIKAFLLTNHGSSTEIILFTKFNKLDNLSCNNVLTF